MKRAETEPRLLRAGPNDGAAGERSRARRRASTPHAGLRQLTEAHLAKVARDMATEPQAGGIPRHKRVYRLKTYRQCFDVEEFVAWLDAYAPLALDRNVSREEAIQAGVQLQRAGVITHVVHTNKAFNERLYLWRFTEQFLNHARLSDAVPTTEGVSLFMPSLPLPPTGYETSQEAIAVIAELNHDDFNAQPAAPALSEPKPELSLYMLDYQPPLAASSDVLDTLDHSVEVEPIALESSAAYGAVDEVASEESIYAVCEGAQELLSERPAKPAEVESAYATISGDDAFGVEPELQQHEDEDDDDEDEESEESDSDESDADDDKQNEQPISSMYSTINDDSDNDGTTDKPKVRFVAAAESESESEHESLDKSAVVTPLEPQKGDEGKVIGIDWNECFQDLYVRFATDEKAPDELYCLQNDFVCAATTYARLIISEMNLPAKLKTIKPVGIGGVAGGEKYIKNNILFKFALDSQIKVLEKGVWTTKWMYGWDSPSHKNAGKSAGRELNGIQAMFVTFTPGLHYPLMCVIDHCGYRIVAVALLPISSDTLKYGSSDGGKTVHADIPELNEAMATACEALGICGHKVKDKTIHGPGDIEAHRGTDGRNYVVDFARLLPPESPSEDPETRQADPRCVFYKLMRPELVLRFKQKHNIHLCSDAFTAWGQFDPRSLDMCRDVITATRYLHNSVIPEFAQRLEASKYAIEYCAFVQSSALQAKRSRPYEVALELLDKFVLGITPDLHASGGNIRHLGRVRSHLGQEALRRLLLVVCVARIAKNNIREQMRGLTSQQKGGTPTDEPYRRLVADSLNLLLGAKGFEEAARTYWTEDVKRELKQQFRMALTEEEQSLKFDLRQNMDMKMFFLYLSRIVGAEIDLKAIKSLWKGLDSSIRSSAETATTTFKFLRSDVVALHPQVKKAFFANLAAGIQYLKEAKQLQATADSVDPTTRQTVLRQLSHARKVLNEAYTMVPSCPVVNLHCGLVTTEIAVLKGGAQCDPLFDNAYERYQKSIDIKPLEAVYGAYAQALRSHAALKRALCGEEEDAQKVDQARQLERRADEVDAARRDDARLALPPPKRCDGREDDFQISAESAS